MKDEKKINRELFIVEAIVGIAACIMTLAMLGISAVIVETQPTIAWVIIVVSIVSFLVICLGLTKMEQVVGYYECKECHYKYVPKYNAVLWSMHFGRTRYMTCPKCHKKTWQKKVLK